MANIVQGTDESGAPVTIGATPGRRLKVDVENEINNSDEEILMELRAIRFGIAKQLDIDPRDLFDEANS